MRDFGIEVQDNSYSGNPKNVDNNDSFVAYLNWKGPINSWTHKLSHLPTRVLNLLKSSNEWNPLKVQFPSATEGDMEEIKTMSTKIIKINHEQENESNILNYLYPYICPIQILNINFQCMNDEINNCVNGNCWKPSFWRKSVKTKDFHIN